jgi:Holliday junction resolvasome RuvABC endonuclease subunit
VRILALDAATRTGWALGEDGVAIGFGALDFAAGLGKLPTRGARLAAARVELEALMRLCEPDLVLLECPFARGVATTRYLYGLAAVAEGLAHEREAAFLDLEPSAVRKRLLGNGSAKKPEVLAWARAQGFALQDHQGDEADALALLEVGMRDVRSEPPRRKRAA